MKKDKQNQAIQTDKTYVSASLFFCVGPAVCLCSMYLSQDITTICVSWLEMISVFLLSLQSIDSVGDFLFPCLMTTFDELIAKAAPYQGTSDNDPFALTEGDPFAPQNEIPAPQISIGRPSLVDSFLSPSLCDVTCLLPLTSCVLFLFLYAVPPPHTSKWSETFPRNDARTIHCTIRWFVILLCCTSARFYVAFDACHHRAQNQTAE